jgi:hypothetical protein
MHLRHLVVRLDTVLPKRSLLVIILHTNVLTAVGLVLMLRGFKRPLEGIKFGSPPVPKGQVRQPMQHHPEL